MDEYCGYDVDDVHSGTDLDEVMCEVCGTIQPAANKVCSNCGEKIRKSSGNTAESGKKKGLFVSFVIGIGMIITTINCIMGFVKEKSAAEKSYEITAEDVKMSELVNSGNYLDGDYVAGEDFPVGEYLLYVEDCFDDSMGYDYGYIGTFHYYSWFQNSFYADFIEGEHVSISGCSLYDLSKPLAENNPFEKAGMFKVGFDLESGTYTVIPDGSGFQPYVKVHKNCKDYDSETFDNSTSPLEDDYEEETITVKNGEYLELRFCKLEK